MVERRMGKREVMIRALSEGGTRQVPASAMAGNPVLPDRALRLLAGLGAATQRHFGSPQDIEWAWTGGRPYILQARPMTALPDPPPPASLAHRMLANNFAEMLPARPYPLDLDTWMAALGGAVEPLFDLMGFDWHLRQLFDEEDGVVIRYNARFPRPTWKTLLTPVRLVSNMLRYNPLHWQSDPLLAEAQARVRDLEARDARLLSVDELLAVARAAKEIPFLAAGEIRRRYFPRAAFAAARLRLLLLLLGQANQFGTLISGVENKTLEMNRALEELAAKIRSNPAAARIVAAQPAETVWSALEQDPAARPFLADLAAFLDRYGHRETVISTALLPTWKDDPAVALGLLKSFAAYPPRPSTGKPAWQAARDEILLSPRLRFAPLRSVFQKSLEEARLLIQIREDTHFYATLAMPLFRRTFLEMGRRLAAAGILKVPEDVFHLQFSELEQLCGFPPDTDGAAGLVTAGLVTAIQRRQEARSRLEKTPLIDPRLYPQSSPSGDALLRGTPGSPGTAEGPVRIIKDGAGFSRLAPGDVLVAPYTNPAWTPLFQRAAAVVVDTGSLASHAAIVAREYGIPAVMATTLGTQILQDGEWVRVDGSQGLVLRAAPPATPPAGMDSTDSAQGAHS
jgi:pyruvate,water dikinase